MATLSSPQSAAAGGSPSETLTAGPAPTLTVVNGGEVTIGFGEVAPLITYTSPDVFGLVGESMAAGFTGAGTISFDAADNAIDFIPAAGYAGSAVADLTFTDGTSTITQLVDIGVVVEASPPMVVPLDTTVTTSGGGLVTTKTYAPGGALVGVETSQAHVGGYTEVDFTDASGYEYASELHSGGDGFTEVERFDGDGNFTGATLQQVTPGQTVIQTQDANRKLTSESVTQVSGAVTQTQVFTGAWVQTSANITTALGGAASLSQDFNGAWTMTGATYTTQPSAGVTIVQTFDGGWSQTGATITTVVGSQVTEQTFDAAWTQTGATVTTYDGAVTETQVFNGGWTQTGATLVTVSGDQTTTQTFDGSWTQTGATIATTVGSGGVASRLDTYNAAWVLKSESDTGANGGVSYYAYGQAGGGDSFAAAAGHSTTFVIQPGQLAGDSFTGLHTVAGAGALHDVIDFVGYGAGAALTQVDATHWQVTAAGDAAETFTVTDGASLAAGDYAFVAALGGAPAVGGLSMSLSSVDATGYLTAADVSSGVVIYGSVADVSMADILGQTVTVMLDNQAFITKVQFGGGWRLTLPAAGLAGLADGASYTLTATVTDSLGDQASATSSVTVDKTVALAINTIDGDGFIDAGEMATGIQITGTSTGAFAGQTVTLTLNNAQFTGVVAADGTWSVELNASALTHLTNGDTYAVTVSGYDITKQGAAATASVTVNETSGASIGVSSQAAVANPQLLTQFMAAGFGGADPSPAAGLAMSDRGGGAGMTLLATPRA